jgi:peptidoglycan/xylan/chitin deacetylase (PgdA/CDA1 family)
VGGVGRIGPPLPELLVALTFDAEHPSRPHCPPGVTERILSILSEADVRGTFFLQGRWVTAHPGTARSIAEAGHVVGNHSHHHGRFSALTPEGIGEDLALAGDAIREATGAEPKPWFRFPFGDGEDSPQIAEAIRTAGYRHVGWHVDPNDWDDARSAEDVESAVLKGVRAHGGGAIVLLHGWPASTALALPKIVSGLRSEGARLVGLDELDSRPSGTYPRS